MAQNDKRREFPSFRTPRIRLAWPKLSEPDYGSKDYPKPDGEYSTKGILDANDPETRAFIAKLQPVYDEAIAEAKVQFAALKPETRKKLKAVTENPLFTALLDQETEQETGELEFKFAKAAGGVFKKGPKTGQKWSWKPTLFDARGQPITRKLDIWSGTIAKVSFKAQPYFIPGTGAAGVKLALEAVQIIELKRGGAKSAKDHGFGQEEGGFSADDLDEEAGSGDDGESEGGGTNAAPGTPDF